MEYAFTEEQLKTLFRQNRWIGRLQGVVITIVALVGAVWLRQYGIL